MNKIKRNLVVVLLVLLLSAGSVFAAATPQLLVNTAIAAVSTLDYEFEADFSDADSFPDYAEGVLAGYLISDYLKEYYTSAGSETTILSAFMFEDGLDELEGMEEEVEQKAASIIPVRGSGSMRVTEYDSSMVISFDDLEIFTYYVDEWKTLKFDGILLFALDSSTIGAGTIKVATYELVYGDIDFGTNSLVVRMEADLEKADEIAKSYEAEDLEDLVYYSDYYGVSILDILKECISISGTLNGKALSAEEAIHLFF